MTQVSWGSIRLDSAMASRKNEGNTRKSSMWVAGLAVRLHGYRDSSYLGITLSPPHRGLSLFCPVLSLLCADRLDTYIFFSLSLPHCVCLLSNLSLDSFQARACTSQTRHISSASRHPTTSSRPSCHKDSHVRQTTYLQT